MTKKVKILIPVSSGIDTKLENIVNGLDTKQLIRGNRLSRLRNMGKYVSNKYQYENTSFDDEIELSSIHFRKNLGTDYGEDLKLMIDNNILQTDGSYKVGRNGLKGICKAYKFNPDYHYTDIKIVEYNAKINAKYQNSYVVKETVKLLSKLRLTFENKEEIEKYVYDKVTFETVKNDRCKINDNIPKGKYKTAWSKKIPSTKIKALELAHSWGKDLILYENKLYAADSAKFIWRKMFDIRKRYIGDLLKLFQLRKRATINCGQNDTNTRLDTNLTNCFGDAIGLLRLDGEKLVGIDLKNSQFTLLANIIENSLEYINKVESTENFIYPTSFNTFKDYYKNINNNTNNKTHNYSYASLTTTTYFSSFYFHLTYYVTKKIIKKRCDVITARNTADSKNDKNDNIKDLYQFINETQNGIFYECFANRCWDDKYKDELPQFSNLFALSDRIEFHKYRSKRGEHPLIKYPRYQMMSEDEHQEHAKYFEKKYKAIRKDAKNTMFLTGFSSYRYSHSDKELLKKYYPTLVEWMQEFKKCSIEWFRDMKETKPKEFKKICDKRIKKSSEKDPCNKLGNAELAVMLQTLESNIFIKVILTGLLKQRYRIFSKHDSILCKESDLKKVHNYMKTELNKILGNGKYKLEIERK